MPAYNGEKTLRRTYDDVPHNLVDEIVLVDDASHDQTVVVAQELGIRTIVHEKNLGYGGKRNISSPRANTTTIASSFAEIVSQGVVRFTQTKPNRGSRWNRDYSASGSVLRTIAMYE